jgi:hypothetical protein
MEGTDQATLHGVREAVPGDAVRVPDAVTAAQAALRLQQAGGGCVRGGVGGVGAV